MTRRHFEPQSVGSVLEHVNRGAGLQVVAPPTVEVDPRTRGELDRLFVRIKAICPGWRSSWPNDEVENAAKAEWLAEIIRQQVTREEQLQAGVRALSAQARPLVPSAGQFCTWCWAPEVFGLPSLDEAYREALANTHPAMVGAAKWSCPAVYWAAAGAGFSRLQALARKDGLAALEISYRQIIKKLARGEALGKVPEGEVTHQKARTQSVGIAALAQLRKQLKGGDRS
ncbi:replication P family protein [Pseudomonas aeruginosa]|uniref:replication protein P n=1 Tax=Pseudomonas aeruginosa TaxID=287 RepID=UPI00167F45A5|nr:replication protein P [Pseudomonas aeruginosa]MBD1288764.1 replication P family protein [Pseudomonas aeruginosa]HCF6211951.1 replication P family protein [Pseudomonas aeruginosa]